MAVNSKFMQPFVSYTTKHAWTYPLSTDSTHDWAADEWSVPLNFLVSKLITIYKQPISLGAGIRYWADSPESPERGPKASAAGPS